MSALLLSGCMTARLYSEQELGVVGQSCGYALGEVVQDEEERKLLLVVTAAEATAAERRCISRWARPRRLHVVFAQVEPSQ